MTNTDTILEYAKALKNSILQQAIQGKLIDLKEDKIIYKDFEEVFETISTKKYQIKEKEILKEGKYPVVSQSKDLIDCYSNEENKLLKLTKPVLIFGDHTRTLKYIDFNFIVGADGTKILKSKNDIYFNTKYLFYILTYYIFNMKNRGYQRHFSLLKKYKLPIISINNQIKVVNKIEEIFSKISIIEREQKNLEILKKALKNSILQQAIQGKIVEQRKEEGTAKELLEEIRKEKQELIKKGKIKQNKKDKKLKPITKDEIPFDIPKSWEWVRLGEICNLENGEKYEEKELLPYLDAKYLRTKLNPKMVNMGEYIKENEYVILVDGENSGEYFKIFCNGIMGSTFKKLIINNNLYIEYIFLILKLNKELFKKNKKGSAIPHLNKDIFYNLLFPLPPLLEQKRIAEKIEKMFEKIDI